MFDVFVEGPVDPSPGAVRKLAETIAAKYGLKADEFAARLSRGRVRVKAKVDRQTADAYARSLAKVGARCTIEEARGGEASGPIVRAATPAVGVPVTRTPPTGVPVRTATPPTGVRAATQPRTATPQPRNAQTPGRGVVTARPPNFAAKRPSTLSDTEPPALRPPAPFVAAVFKTPARPSETSQPIASALAAADGAPVDTHLGALDGGAGALTLSSLDGHATGMSVAPESSGSFGPAVDLDAGPYAVASTDKPKDEPLDLFAPADDGADFKVDIAPEDVRKPSMPVPRPQEAPMPAAVQRAVESPAKSRSKLGPLSDLKIRFAAGVVAAILVGFLPATIVASIREHAAFRAIDEQYLKEVETSQDPELDAKFLDKKRSERRGIALTSMVIWAVAGGAIAYVWFRRVPWDRWA